MRPADLLPPSPQFPSATEKCTLNCLVLDNLLAGGIPCRSITELVAESGAGKTQICLQLLLCAQLPASLGGLSSSSLFLHSEFPFPLRRLRQLSQSPLLSPHLSQFPGDPLDRIFIHPIHDAEDLLDLLLKFELLLLNNRSSTQQWPIRVIVIDSIAALFRADFDNNPRDMKRRSALFFKISGKLRSLAVKFGLAIFVTNQVVDYVESDRSNGSRDGNMACLVSSGRRVLPALGLAWSNCVNSRLFLSRMEEIVGGVTGSVVDEAGGDSVLRRTRRYMHVVFAPHLPSSSCEFEILKDGVFGIQR